MNHVIYISLAGIVLALLVGVMWGKRKGNKQGVLATERRWVAWSEKMRSCEIRN